MKVMGVRGGGGGGAIVYFSRKISNSFKKDILDRNDNIYCFYIENIKYPSNIVMREKYENVNTRVMYNIPLKGPVQLHAHQRNEDRSYEHEFVNAFFLSYFEIP